MVLNLVFEPGEVCAFNYVDVAPKGFNSVDVGWTHTLIFYKSFTGNSDAQLSVERNSL